MQTYKAKGSSRLTIPDMWRISVFLEERCKDARHCHIGSGSGGFETPEEHSNGGI
jgi:hypothetical protein